MNPIPVLLLGAFLGASLQAAAPAPAVFPKPNPERAFAELKTLGADGSPLRKPVEDWDGAARRVKSDPEWAAWLKARRAEVDDWTRRGGDRLEWVTGYWHNFISPKDGSFLTWTPDEPGEETLGSRSDPKVRLTPKLHDAWVYGFRSRHAGKIEEAARLYRLTGAPQYAQWAAGQLDFYATNLAVFAARPRQGGACIMWQSLDEAVILVHFVQAAQCLEGYVAPERRQRWSDLLFKPEAELLEASVRRIHNIACWHRSAIGLVALYTRDAALWDKAVEGPYGIRRQVACGITGDYLWYEQSLGYNSYVVSALLPFFRQAALNGRFEELRPEMAAVENLMLSPTLLRFPTGQLPTPADTTGVPRRGPDTGAWAGARGLFPTPQGEALAARQRSWDTLLDPPAPPARVPPLPEPASVNFESSRMAVLKRGPWQVFFHYGQVTASHAQSEALNFELFHGKTDISHDTGTVGYGSPLHREYYTKGLCHNIPLVDGQGQDGWQPGELIAFDPAAGRASARQPLYRKDASAERELLLTDGRFTDRVTLETKPVAGVTRRLGLALHLQGHVRLPESFQPDAAFAAAPRPPAFGYWRDARTARFQDEAVFEVECDGLRLRLRLQTPGSFTLTHASAPDAPPRRREAFYLETTGTRAVFTTILEKP